MLLLSFFRVFADGEEVGSVNDLFQLARPNTTLQILLRVARDTIESNHECFYNALDRLDIERPEHLHKLSRVTFELFGDGVTNWGRVATLLSFCALVARHLKNLGMDDSIFMMADGIARFLTVTKRYWFLENRGWDGFVAVYSVRWLQIRVGLLTMAWILGCRAGLGRN
uniref:Bcl-2 Bcl-2 homology region 1-3 domain-containing protein n=1 Tax=Leptobrachium leishanense TaxID=445787 RepID=A0A8C5PZP2_9ANUR